MFNGTGSQTDTNGRWGDYSYDHHRSRRWHELLARGRILRDNQRFQLAHAHRQIRFPRRRRKPNANSRPLHRLPAVGRPDRTCQVSEPAWLASFSQLTGSFTPWAGAASDAAGSEFTHPFEYDPVTNTWTTKSATYPDNHVNNMACGVLTDAGTPYIYCVGGSQVTLTDDYRSRIPLQPCYRRDQPGCCSLARCHGNDSARWLHGLQQQALYPGRIRHYHERRTGPTRSGSLLPARPPGCRRPLSCLFRSATYPPRPSAASSTQVGAAISRLALLPIRQTPLSITRWRIPSARLPPYREPQARRGHLTSVTRCMSWAVGEPRPIPRTR